MWCLINLCFFGLLRISSVTVRNRSSWDSANILTRGDIKFTPTGCLLSLRNTKTIQFQERVFQAAIPRLEGDPLCPASSLLTFLNMAGNLPDCSPALAYHSQCGQLVTITPPQARERFKKLLNRINVPSREYNTHSLRRSGASHLMSAGVDISVIRTLGDWKSDAIFRYLKPLSEDSLKLAKQGFSSSHFKNTT